MAVKSANLYARIEPDIKEQAESILAALGIPASNAINMFYKQIILQRGLPFDVKLPPSRPVAIGSLSREELDEEIERGYNQMLQGETEPAETVFADIHREYGI
jgi:addiction module antitoxin, RelB/DinJ family